VGWTKISAYAYDSINRSTAYGSGSGYAVMVLKDSIYCGGMTKLFQTVEIPTTDLSFSVKAKLYAWANTADTLLWAGAAVVVYYKNAAGSTLGETRIIRKSIRCPWTSTSILHLIYAADENWNTYSFNIQTELANLPGVNPTQVKYITVAAFDSTYHSC
jgi:hypothetical protein